MERDRVDTNSRRSCEPCGGFRRTGVGTQQFTKEIYQWNGSAWTNIPGDLLAIAVDGVAALGVEYQAPSGQTGIKHIFVLMMENRSYDHFLGYSFITGTDTQTGQPTTAEGLVNADGSLKGDYYNDFTFSTWQAPTTPSPSVSATSDAVNRNPPPPPPPPPPYWMTSRYPVTNTAGDETFDHQDPQHQFPDVMMQLCGQGGVADPYLNGRPYPQVAEATKTGFAADYALQEGVTAPGRIVAANPGEPMKVLCPGKPPGFECPRERIRPLRSLVQFNGRANRAEPDVCACGNIGSLGRLANER